MYPAKHRSQSHKGKQAPGPYLQCNPFTMCLNIFKVFYTLINMGEEKRLATPNKDKKRNPQMVMQ